MKIERTKNATRNIIFGTILKGYQIAVPFIMRTVIMYELGVKYLGLNGLFTSVLQVLNLAELGVGSAMVFSMYRPIVDDDTGRINAFLYLYKLYYRIIGLVILALGLALTPFIPKLISGSVPDSMNVYILYLLNLGTTVMTYWLFSYRKSILQAHQRNDVISKVTLFSDTVKYIIQILVLVLLHNYYFYVLAILFSSALDNIITALISRKMYPDYYPSGRLDSDEVKNLNQKIRDLFTSKLGGTIVNSADTIVISAFLGLEALAIYQNYYYILSAVMGFLTIIYSSIVAGIGNSMLVKTLDQNRTEFMTFTFLIAWLSTICVSCFLVLYQPFMKIWMGKNLLLDYGLVALLCVYFWVFEIVKMISVYKDAGGIWHHDRWRPLISGLANLMMNIVMVRFIGLYGIVLSTIISVSVISVPWIVKNVFTHIFRESPSHYYLSLLNYTMGIVVIGVLCFLITYKLPDSNIMTLVLKGIVAAFISNVSFVFIYRRSAHFQDAKRQLVKMLKLTKLFRHP